MRRTQENELMSALDRLPRWSGSVEEIQRCVRMRSDKNDRLVKRVLEVSKQLGQELQIEQSDAAVTFHLRTPDAGGVTDSDIELAKRIDTLVLEVDTVDLPAAG